jgi:hypothetical protein
MAAFFMRGRIGGMDSDGLHILVFVVVALVLYGRRVATAVMGRFKERKRKRSLNRELSLRTWERN